MYHSLTFILHYLSVATSRASFVRRARGRTGSPHSYDRRSLDAMAVAVLQALKEHPHLCAADASIQSFRSSSALPNGGSVRRRRLTPSRSKNSAQANAIDVPADDQHNELKFSLKLLHQCAAVYFQSHLFQVKYLIRYAPLLFVL